MGAARARFETRAGALQQDLGSGLGTFMTKFRNFRRNIIILLQAALRNFLGSRGHLGLAPPLACLDLQ